MSRRNGAVTISTLLFTILILAMLGASAVFTAGAVGRRSAARGEQLLKEGDYARAAVLLERSIKLSLRAKPAVLVDLAEAKLKLGDRATAKALYANAAELEPENAQAHYGLAGIYAEDKDVEGLRKEIKALDSIGTEEAKALADELRKSAAGDSIKGLVNDLVNKILPGVPDALKRALPGADGATQEETEAGGSELARPQSGDITPEAAPQEDLPHVAEPEAHEFPSPQGNGDNDNNNEDNLNAAKGAEGAE